MQYQLLQKTQKKQKNIGKNKTYDEVAIELNKCWNKSRTYFKVPDGSKQWNICCAILSVHNPYGIDMPIKQVEENMRKKKKYFSKYD